MFQAPLRGLWGHDYKAYVKGMFEKIANTIRNDLRNGEWHNDFLKDAEAERLREAVRQLEKCGIACYDINNMIDKLDWYVEADKDRVRKLQESLNALNFTPALLEDGILGEKTIEAWETFCLEFQKANCPTAWNGCSADRNFGKRSIAAARIDFLR